VKKLFRNSFKEVAEIIEEPNRVYHSQVVSQVVQPPKISETTIEEAAKLFDR
jgi:hypothetical protein